MFGKHFTGRVERRIAAHPIMMAQSMTMKVADEKVMELEEEQLSKCFLLCIHTVLDGC